MPSKLDHYYRASSATIGNNVLEKEMENSPEKKCSILIVDDNINFCKSMSLILERKGYDITTAKSGLEAIAKVKERPFDLIFMDSKMPFMDGLETYRRIKKLKSDIVIAMLTAYMTDNLVQEALEEGVCQVISKPINIEKITALTERLRKTKA